MICCPESSECRVKENFRSNIRYRIFLPFFSFFLRRFPERERERELCVINLFKMQGKSNPYDIPSFEDLRSHSSTKWAYKEEDKVRAIKKVVEIIKDAWVFSSTCNVVVIPDEKLPASSVLRLQVALELINAYKYVTVYVDDPASKNNIAIQNATDQLLLHAVVANRKCIVQIVVHEQNPDMGYCR